MATKKKAAVKKAAQPKGKKRIVVSHEESVLLHQMRKDKNGLERVVDAFSGRTEQVLREHYDKKYHMEIARARGLDITKPISEEDLKKAALTPIYTKGNPMPSSYVIKDGPAMQNELTDIKSDKSYRGGEHALTETPKTLLESNIIFMQDKLFKTKMEVIKLENTLNKVAYIELDYSPTKGIENNGETIPFISKYDDLQNMAHDILLHLSALIKKAQQLI